MQNIIKVHWEILMVQKYYFFLKSDVENAINMN